MSEESGVDTGESVSDTEVAAISEEQGSSSGGSSSAEQSPTLFQDDTPPPAPAPEQQEATQPDWFLKDKYKSMEDQAEAYFHLQKKMGGAWGAPKDGYNFEDAGLAKDDPLIGAMAPKLQEMGLSQKGLTDLTKAYNEALDAAAKDLEAKTVKELTENDAMTVKSVNDWLNQSFDDSTKQTLRNMVQSVDDFKALNSLRLMMPAKDAVPSTTGGAAVQRFEKSSEVEQERLAYRKEVLSGKRVENKAEENAMLQRWRDAKQREMMAEKKR